MDANTPLPNSIEDVLALLGPIEGVRINNHWVPSSYLEAFTSSGTAEGALHLYDRDSPDTWRAIGVRVAAVNKHLYVAESPRIEVPDIIERFLATFIEKPFPQIRPRLLEQARAGIHAPLPRADRAALALWIAVQHRRTPRQRDFHLWVEEIHATFTALVALRDRETGEDRRSRRRMKFDLLAERLTIKSPRDRWIGSFLAQAFELSESLGAMHYSVFRVPVGLYLPASDSPVVVSRRLPGQLAYQFEAGVGHADVEVLLPLSPSAVLVLRHAASDPVLGTGEWAESVLERVGRNADRFLYASAPSNRISDILRQPPKPEEVVEIDGEQFRVGTSPAIVANRIMKSRGDTVRFGPRRRR